MPRAHSPLLLLLGSLLPRICQAHGRLTVPQGQSAATGSEGTSGYSPCWKCSNGQSKWYANGKSGYCCETHPTEFNIGTDESFVCRHAGPQNNNAPVQMVAGQKFGLKWDMIRTAEHQGDCAVFISYDVDKPRREQKYVKIANLPYCRQQELELVSIDIPSGLPAGRAILRWDWLAYHLWPSIEWYVQCADVQIESTSGRDISTLDSYSIIDPPIYPQNCREGVGCRDPFAGNGRSEQDTGYITGPACFDGSLNQCDLTAPGTRGYTGFGAGTSSPTPSPAPSPPAPPRPSPTPAPAPPPPQPSSCNKVKYTQCGGSGFSGDTCCPVDMWCMYDNEWWSQCEPCDETWNAACDAMPQPSPSPSLPSPAPSPPSYGPPSPSPSPPSAPPSPQPTPQTPSFGFKPVDGGEGRACRGDSTRDNSADHYKLFSGVYLRDDCKAMCVSEPSCRGIEHSSSGRCEVWTRPEGIGASVAVAGYTCLAVATGPSTPTCAKEKYAQCGGSDFSGDTCCPAGTWCMRLEACDDPGRWWAQCEPCDRTPNSACPAPALVEVRSQKFLSRGRQGILGTAWVQTNASTEKHVQTIWADGTFEEL